MSKGKSMKVVKTMAIKQNLVQRAEKYAFKRGLYLSEVVEEALEKHLENKTELQFEPPKEPLKNLLFTLAEGFNNWFPDKINYPQDIIREVFKKIQNEPILNERYNSAIAGPDGKPDLYRTQTTNQRIGKMIKEILNAKVIGRQEILPGTGELIKSFSLLAPKN